jgi:hypothetical protein
MQRPLGRHLDPHDPGQPPRRKLAPPSLRDRGTRRSGAARTGRGGQDAALFLEGIADQLFLPGQRECGAVLLSPGQVERGTGFEMMVLDETLEGARRRAEALERRLAGGKTRAE